MKPAHFRVANHVLVQQAFSHLSYPSLSGHCSASAVPEPPQIRQMTNWASYITVHFCCVSPGDETYSSLDCWPSPFGHRASYKAHVFGTPSKRMLLIEAKRHKIAYYTQTLRFRGGGRGAPGASCRFRRPPGGPKAALESALVPTRPDANFISLLRSIEAVQVANQRSVIEQEITSAR